MEVHALVRAESAARRRNGGVAQSARLQGAAHVPGACVVETWELRRCSTSRRVCLLTRYRGMLRTDEPLGQALLGARAGSETEGEQLLAQSTGCRRLGQRGSGRTQLG